MKRNTPFALAGVLVCTAIAGVAGASGPKVAAPLVSGVEIGGRLAPFEPTHVAGPDAGTRTCPVCKYGARPAVQVWLNTEDMKSAASIAQALDRAVAAGSRSDLKGFVVFIRRSRGAEDRYAAQLREFATKNNLHNVGVTYVDAPSDQAVRSYRINTDPKVRNTVFVYRDRKVQSKFVNLPATSGGLDELAAAVRQVETN